MNYFNKRIMKDFIKQSKIFGNIKMGAKSWDDREALGEDFLLRSKIIKITIYNNFYKGFKAISGLTLTFRNLINNEIREIEYKGKKDYYNFKTININKNEYFVNFHIRIPDFKGYISELEFSTNKNNKIIFGEEKGDNKIIKSNGGENIILGTYGYYGDQIDAIGIYYIKKNDFLNVTLYGYYVLKYLIKRDANFKDNWNNKYKDLQITYQYLWKTVNMPDKIYYGIIKYLN